MSHHILVVEDDANLGRVLTDYLSLRGYAVDLARDGRVGIERAMLNRFDLCLLDIMLPVEDGFSVARQLKSTCPQLPIIFLTAKSNIEDKRLGFTLGADDYLTKPFHMDELAMRMTAVLRRSALDATHEEPAPTHFTLGSLVYDYTTRKLLTPTQVHKLSAREADLLCLLCRHQNRLVERSLILNTIWGDDGYYNGRSMDVYITRLRKYLQPEPDVQIINDHGRGYRLVIPQSQ